METQYSLDFMAANHIMLLSEGLADVEVAYVKELTQESLRERIMRHHFPKQVHWRAYTREALSAALVRHGSIDSSIKDESLTMEEKTSLDKLANDAPAVNLVNSLILDVLPLDASDIHFEVDGDKMVVRCRVHGALRVFYKDSAERFRAVATRIKLLANLNILETRRPQEGRMTLTLNNREIHMRVSCVPLARGESIVLRIFNRSELLRTPENLGFSKRSIEEIRKMFKKPYGLILATGPTGSGKTTTLRAFLSEISSESKKTITLEDPIEYLMPGIDQIPIRDDIELTFSSLLRRILRQDPDIIMVGEIRDGETAQLSVRAALTGHLVVSTLHTNDAPSAVKRLVDMGVPPYLIAGILRGVMAQRLVPELCPHCLKFRPLTDEEQTYVKRYGEDFSETGESAGCNRCGNTGYQGRTAIMESFSVTPELESAISRQQGNGTQWDVMLKTINCTPMIFHGFEKVEDRVISLTELRKVLG